MFPKLLAFIRHAESEKNRIMRQLDQDLSNEELIVRLNTMSDHKWPITPEGKQRAEWVGSLLPTLFDFEQRLPKLYTSSHLRNIQTSTALSSTWERPASLWQQSDQQPEWPCWIVDPNLCERAWGTEMSWRQFQTKHPKDYAEWLNDPLRFRPKFFGGESINDVRNSRAERFLRRIERDCTNEDVVIVVTHYDWMLSCRSLLENLDPFQFRMMHQDPTQQINNLDILCYSCTREAAIYQFPLAVGLIHLPPEEAILDEVEPIAWKYIDSHSYNREELIHLAAD
jgi:broad specificity phosphatase PhoE